jgi:hypothetical protein
MKESALAGASFSGSGAQIRTEDLQVMSSLPKTGALDRQASVPRVTLRFSTTRNPASISLNYPTRGG